MTKKTIVGKSPSSGKKSIGNADCRLNDVAASIIPLVEKYVHAVRVEDEIVDIQRDTMYIMPKVNISLNVIRSINTVFDENSPGYYEEMGIHINENARCNEFFDLSNITQTIGDPMDAISIKVNGVVAGYYLPSLNSWLTGFWTWHIHYITIVLGQVFPQIVTQLQLTACPNAINASDSKKPVKRLTVSMGADPELEVTKNGKVVNACTVIQCSNHLSSPIGLDGQQSQLEFRPQPGTPQQVMKNIRKLVKEFSTKYPEFDLSDEGDRYPLGGHIHVGLNREIEVPNDLRVVLDDFVGRPTIEMSGDARSSYKQLGATRTQKHGFEYRSTPAAVFQNPAMTFVTLRLVKNLCEKYFNQDTLEYNARPTLDDYINVGGLTKNQAKYFMRFCENYMPMKSIRASWKVPAAPVVMANTFPLNIEFRDDWHDEVAFRIREELSASNIETVRPVVISFYGLKADRGENMSTIPLSGSSVIGGQFPKPVWRDNVLNIGFSLDMRMTGIGSSRRRELIRAISSYLQYHEVLA